MKKYGRKFTITKECLSHVFGAHILCSEFTNSVLARAVKNIILVNLSILESPNKPIECAGFFDISNDMYTFRLTATYHYGGFAEVKEGHDYPTGYFTGNVISQYDTLLEEK